MDLDVELSGVTELEVVVVSKAGEESRKKVSGF